MKGACKKIERLVLRKAGADRAGDRAPLVGITVLHDEAENIGIVALLVEP